MKDLQGRVAVVTGASRGLGERIAVRLAQQGAAVALLARSQAGLEETQRQIASLGAHSLIVPVDLGDASSVANAKGVIERDLGVPSVLINAAGEFGPIDLIRNTDPSAWIQTIIINLVGSYLTCRAFVGEWLAPDGDES